MAKQRPVMPFPTAGGSYVHTAKGLQRAEPVEQAPSETTAAEPTKPAPRKTKSKGK